MRPAEDRVKLSLGRDQRRDVDWSLGREPNEPGAVERLVRSDEAKVLLGDSDAWRDGVRWWEASGDGGGMWLLVFLFGFRGFYLFKNGGVRAAVLELVLVGVPPLIRPVETDLHFGAFWYCEARASNLLDIAD